MKALKITSIALLVIAIIFGGSFLLIKNLLKSDPNIDKYNAHPSTDLIDKSVESALANEEIELSEEDINGFFAYCIDEDYLSTQSSSDLVIKNISVDLKDDDSALFYISYNYKGTDYDLTSEIELTFDSNSQRFLADIESVKIGYIKLPVKLALSMVEDKMPYGVDIKNNTMYLDYNKIASKDNLHKNIIKIENFRLDEGKAYIKLPKVTDTASNYVKEIIQEGISKGSEYINSILDNITGFFIGE